MNDTRSRRHGAWLVAAVMGLVLLVGCSDVVSGTGSTSAGGSSSSPDFPSPTGGPSSGSSRSGPSSAGPANTSGVPTPTPVVPSAPSSVSLSPSLPAGTVYACPNVKFVSASFSFTCITTGLTTSSAPGGVWPLREYRTVEPSTGWSLETGGGHWGPPAGRSLTAIATTVRQRMVADEDYGTSPSVDTVASTDTRVGGMRAHVLQTTVTLSPAFRTTRKTKVKREKLWIVALQVGTNDVSLWYTSLPDLSAGLWAKVPAAIRSIRRI